MWFCHRPGTLRQSSYTLLKLLVVVCYGYGEILFLLTCDGLAQFSIKIHCPYGMQFQLHFQIQNFNCGENDSKIVSKHKPFVKIINI